MKTITLLLGIGLQASVHASAIVGAWVHNNGAAGDSDTLVFLENGYYFHVEDLANGGTMQRGSYVWDEMIGQVTLTSETATDGSRLPEVIDFQIDGDSADGGEFIRVQSVSNPLVGGWSFGDVTVEDGDGGVVVFLENGVYFHAEDIVADSSSQDGMERGTYTWDGATGVFTASPTTDTNGDVGLSDPDGDVVVRVFGDLVAYQDGPIFKTQFTRVVAAARRSLEVSSAQSLMTSNSEMLGVMISTVPGFFYTVERSSDLGASESSVGLEGTGEMSPMLLETDPETTPRAFFRTRVALQKAVGSAEISELLGERTINGITFASDGTWSGNGQTGEWTYRVTSADEGVVEVTFDSSSNDPSQSRQELVLDFAEVDDPAEIPAELKEFSGGVETSSATLSVDLGSSQSQSLAPTEAAFTSLIGGKTIEGINFGANNRWSSFGDDGNWSYVVTSDSTATLTLTFDSDANDPALARDDYFFTFTEAGGLGAVSTRLEISDFNVVDDTQNLTIDLTQNTFAPTLASLASILDERAIVTPLGTTVFSEEGSFVFNQFEPGEWTASEIDANRLLIVQTYDEDGNNPNIFREELTLTFDGTTSVEVDYREIEGGVETFSADLTVVID